MEYITINKDKFTRELFEPIRNYHKKPLGGFWASPYTKDQDYVSAWHSWCKFNMPEWLSNDAVIFTIKENTRIYTIDSQQDLINLIKEVGTTNTGYAFREKLIDFEAAALKYSAIYLTEKGQEDTRIPMQNYDYNLYGWHPESILLLNYCIDAWKYTKLDIV